VSRSSVYTTKSSLPGEYSHRSRTLVLNESTLELYCSSPLKNIRGVTVKLTRARGSAAVKRPSGRSTQLTDRLGSTESCGVTSMRPRFTPIDVLSPLQKLPERTEIVPLIGRCWPNE